MQSEDGDLSQKSVSMEAHMRVAVVSVQGLTKRYGKVVAVEELTFALEPGTITGFLGPNPQPPLADFVDRVLPPPAGPS